MSRQDSSGQFGLEELLFWREHHDRVPPSAPAARRAAHTAGAQAARQRIHDAVTAFLEQARTPANSRALELTRSSYGAEELLAAIDVLLNDRMTMGELTARFEREWSTALGAGGSLMVNSGSSANLLILAALAAPDVPNGLKPGDEVLVPAVAWSTSIFPIVQAGCLPVFVDVDPETLNIDPQAVERAVTPRTRAIMAIHILGNPCDMMALADLARARGLWLIEDSCEAHGARVNGQLIGTFGDLSSFSFYFSHHMTTVEGGMISYRDDERWHDRLMSLRAHGWVRGRRDRDAWRQAHRDIDDRWLFVSAGYNVRPTDISAAFGLVQLGKLPAFVRQRQAVRRALLSRLERAGDVLMFQRELPGHEHSAFGFSVIVRPEATFTRAALQSALEARQIETRPIVGSNFARQPVMRHLPHRTTGPLSGADLVHDRGVMIGIHPDVSPAQIDHVAEVVLDFVDRHR